MVKLSPFWAPWRTKHDIVPGCGARGRGREMETSGAAETLKVLPVVFLSLKLPELPEERRT